MMAGVRNRKIRRAISLFLVMLYFSGLTAQAQYGGGTGTAEDPYLIYTAEQMNAIGANSNDLDKHFKLMADIDLTGFDYDAALIAQDIDKAKSGFQGTSFTGVFDGNGQTISHLRIEGGSYLGLFGQLESGSVVKNLGVVDVNITGSNSDLGGLVGSNSGYVNNCYSTGTVSGTGRVGGLVGRNVGVVTHCYSTGSVSGTGNYVGGLVGYNYAGTVVQCYSTGAVSGHRYVGGLVGGGDPDRVRYSFWDMETSHLTISTGGAGLTTAEMMDPEMLGLNGFGGDPNWVLDNGRDYPRLIWEGTPGQMIPEPVIDWLDGSGTPEDPFQIENADQLLLLHDYSFLWLWDKHFVLNADIDLDPNLPGRGVFEQAVIPTFWGSFVGNGHVIQNLQIEGGGRLGLFGKLIEGSVVRDLGLENVLVHGTGNNIGGLVGRNYGSVLKCYSTGEVSGDRNVGGLVAYNYDGTVVQCYSTGAVSGDYYVGGLIGQNYGSAVTNCYSTAAVSGRSSVGGLVGRYLGDVIHHCYSAGTVCGDWYVGGLVGEGSATQCFWDTWTSGQATSDGGTGKTTTEMQLASTFLKAGWDFVGETENGREDIWWILEGQDYPKLRGLPEDVRLQPFLAFCPQPQDGAIDVIQSSILYWAPATNPTLQHDIYFGEDKEAVSNATTLSLDIYCGRQPGEATSYAPGSLEWGKTYYWRIDECNMDATISKGPVWSFTTANFIVVDDIEDYNDYEPNRIFDFWIDGWGDPENGSEVGYAEPDWVNGPKHHVETDIVHGGWQSMPYFYDNTNAKYSEATRTLDWPRDWTQDGVGLLSLWFYGRTGSLGSFTEWPDGTYTMTAKGPGIRGFHYAFKQLTGPGTIVAKVESVRSTNHGAKAGVMIMETLEPRSKYAFVGVTSNYGITFQSRNAYGFGFFSTGESWIPAPCWIKLERDVSGNFTGYYSTNGMTWEQIENATPKNIPMSETVYVGLALTAPDTDMTSEAEFSNVQVNGTVSAQWSNQDIGLASNAPERMYVSLANANGMTGTVYHDDPHAAQMEEWTEWIIDLQEFAEQGVDLTDVDTISIGFSDKNNLGPGGSGLVFFDDIRLYRPAELEPASR